MHRSSRQSSSPRITIEMKIVKLTNIFSLSATPLKASSPLAAQKQWHVQAKGPSNERRCDVFIFEDVFDELSFAAKSGRACGLLLGQINAYENPNDATRFCPTNAETVSDAFNEIVAFRDIYPVENTLDYAVTLRKRRTAFREDESGQVVGLVQLRPHKEELCFEDVMLQRSYFNHPYQVALFVYADGSQAEAYALTSDSTVVEIGFYVVNIGESE